ncbi:MAG TPA: N-acetylmuramoyl-L-alanine amidase [Vicinamibacterales bacterium]
MARQTGRNSSISRLRRVVCALLVCGAATVPLRAAVPVRTMYDAAFAREKAVRTAMDAANASPDLLQEVHAVIGAYQAVVAKYPTSSYCDNALWQAGRLALDAFVKFGQARDKESGIYLLRKLAVSYPSSKLARQVPDQIASAESAAPAAAIPAAAQPFTSVRVPPTMITSQPLAEPASRVAPPAPRLAQPTVPSASSAPTAPTGPTKIATIKAIRRSVLPDAVRIVIELDAEVSFHDERITDPARVFLDLPGTRAVPALVDQTIRFDSDAEPVRQIRIGRHPNNTTRVVLDAAEVSSYSVYPLYAPYRLVIDCIRQGKTTAGATAIATPIVPRPLDARDLGRASKLIVKAPTAEPRLPMILPAPAPLTARRLPPERIAPVRGQAPLAGRLIADARASADVVAAPLHAEALPSAAVVPPTQNMTGGFSIARQLGLGVSRIVIDAGHGGHDPGAKGKGVTEAEVVLDVALRLEKLLQKVPGIEVILTRRTDDFIELPERTAIANREGADLFLSIHANASPNAQARGIETYFLNFANNVSAAAVAARENANSTQAMGALPDFVKAIALNNKLDESRDLATQVQHAMFERMKGTNKTLKDLGVKQAPFVVLIGAAMPSVLAEISFVTNPQEARLIKSNQYRQKIAESLFEGIRKYQTSLKNTGTIALQ